MIRFTALGLVLTAGVAAAVAALNPPADGPELCEEEVDIRPELVDRCANYRVRIELKRDLVHRVVAGEVTLADATAAFLHLNRDVPEVMDAVRTGYPGSSDEEKTAANLLTYVELADIPDAAKRLALDRLTREFRARYGADPLPQT